MYTPMNSCKRGLYRKEVSFSRKQTAARLRQEWKQRLTKFRRAVSVKMAMEDREASNFEGKFKRLKPGSKGDTDETKGIWLDSDRRRCMGEAPHTRDACPIQGRKRPLYTVRTVEGNRSA